MASFLVNTRVYLGCSLQGDVYVFQETTAGGGLRVLTLLVAFTASIIATTIHTPIVQADEGDTLYCINASDVKIRPYTGTGTVTDIARITLNSSSISSPLIDMVGAKIDGKWTAINTETCKPVSVTKISFNGAPWNLPDAQPTTLDISSRNPHSGIGTGFNGSMVDSDGRLWFSTNDDATMDLHASETYRFSHIAGYADSGNPNIADLSVARGHIIEFDDGYKIVSDGSTPTMTGILKIAETHYRGTVCLGHRVAGSDQPSSVVQMPTTGAPDGLSTVGILAVGIGFAGITLMLSRRHD